MKKIFKFVLVLFLLILVALAVIYYLLGNIVRTGVETVGPEATGANVTLADVDLSLFSGQAALGGFVIGNPEGFTSKNAFELGKVAVGVDLVTVFDDVIIVKDIFIDGAKITWEGWAGDNHRKIMENIEKYTGGPVKKETDLEKKEPPGPQKKVIIENVQFQNSSIAFVISGKQIAELEFPNLHLTDIGRKQGGQTIKEALQQMYQQIIESLGRAVTQNSQLLQQKAAELQLMGKEMLQQGKEVLEKGQEVIEKGKEALDGDLKSVPEKAAEGVREITKGIGDLLNKK